MLLRRALVGAPLAVLVAVLAHGLEFGQSHAVAGANGPALIGTTLALLALLCTVAPLWLALLDARGCEGRARLRTWLPGSGGLGRATASLALGGYAVLAAIEASEGRSPLPGFGALAGLLVAAVCIALLARLFCDWLGDWGSLLARAMRTFARRVPSALVVAPAPVRSSGIARRGRQRGRAPPNRP